MVEDEEGPLIGWSISSAMRAAETKRSSSDALLEDLHDFPCTFSFKAVAVAESKLGESLRELVGSTLGREVPADALSTRDSKKGTYRSFTIAVMVENKEEIYKIYAALRGDKRVKYVL